MGSVNRRTQSGTARRPHAARSPTNRSVERRSQAERRRQTRRALLDAALDQMDRGFGFDSLSLRRVTRAAGVVPAAFYRHFASMDELGLALVEESMLTLRSMLREAREGGPEPDHLIARSVGILVAHVGEHRRHFAFMAHASRYTGNVVLRHAVRNEIRLFTSELATDISRFPILRDWTTADLQMLAGLFVETMIATIDAILEASSWATGPDALSQEAEARIAKQASKQLRLIMLGVPRWRSHLRLSVPSGYGMPRMVIADPRQPYPDPSWSGWGDPARGAPLPNALEAVLRPAPGQPGGTRPAPPPVPLSELAARALGSPAAGGFRAVRGRRLGP